MNHRDTLLHAVGQPPLFDAGDLNWRTVRIIAMHSVPVKAAITLAETKGWTQEQALVLAIYGLAEQVASLTDKAIEAAKGDSHAT